MLTYWNWEDYEWITNEIAAADIVRGNPQNEWAITHKSADGRTTVGLSRLRGGAFSISVDFPEFVTVVRGGLIVTCEGQDPVHLKEGECLTPPIGRPHTLEPEGDEVMNLFMMMDPEVTGMMPDPPKPASAGA